jgi:hypothetical protein
MLGYDPKEKAAVIPYSPTMVYYQRRYTKDRRFYKPKSDKYGAEPLWHPENLELKSKTPVFVRCPFACGLRHSAVGTELRRPAYCFFSCASLVLLLYFNFFDGAFVLPIGLQVLSCFVELANKKPAFVPTKKAGRNAGSCPWVFSFYFELVFCYQRMCCCLFVF